MSDSKYRLPDGVTDADVDQRANGNGDTVKAPFVVPRLAGGQELDATHGMPTAQVDFGDHTATAITDPTNVTTSATLLGLVKGWLTILKDVWNNAIHALQVTVTDGNHLMPTMDSAARPGFVTVTDLGAHTDAAVSDPTNVTSAATLIALAKGILAVYGDVHDVTDHAWNVNIVKDSTPAIANPLPTQPSDGTNNAAVRAGSAEVAFADAALAVAQRPTEVHVGEVGGNSKIVKQVIGISTTAYASGDVVGTLMDLGAILRKLGGTGVLQSLLVKDHANQKAPLTILLFDAQPGGTFTDNVGGVTFTQTDLDKVIRELAVASTDYTTVGGSAIADLSPGGRVVAGNASQHLWMLILTTGTPTYAATTDLTVHLGFLLD